MEMDASLVVAAGAAACGATPELDPPHPAKHAATDSSANIRIEPMTPPDFFDSHSESFFLNYRLTANETASVLERDALCSDD
jgi:hypothetical protein